MPPPTQSRARVRPAKPSAEAIHPFDLEHNVHTSGLIPATHLRTGHVNDEHVTAYYGVAPSILRALIDLWLTTSPSPSIEQVTFIDIGAGKGRGLLIAAEHPFHAVLGIELNPTLVALARRNLTEAKGHHLAPITLIEQDALEFYFPQTSCLLFLFHPFEAPVLSKLLSRIERQFANCPGTLDLLYVNSEHAAILDAHTGFNRLFFGRIAMSREDYEADRLAIATQTEYGSTGDEECAIYRFTDSASLARKNGTLKQSGEPVSSSRSAPQSARAARSEA